MRVWKYELSESLEPETLNVPADAEILSVQEQHGRLQLWLLVEDQAPMRVARVWKFFTGYDEIPSHVLERAAYAGTVQRGATGLVYHVWVELP